MLGTEDSEAMAMSRIQLSSSRDTWIYALASRYGFCGSSVEMVMVTSRLLKITFQYSKQVGNVQTIL